MIHKCKSDFILINSFKLYCVKSNITSKVLFKFDSDVYLDNTFPINTLIKCSII